MIEATWKKEIPAVSPGSMDCWGKSVYATVEVFSNMLLSAKFATVYLDE
jgi:hypothetical protein